jgi:hypothetical protein
MPEPSGGGMESNLVSFVDMSIIDNSSSLFQNIPYKVRPLKIDSNRMELCGFYFEVPTQRYTGKKSHRIFGKKIEKPCFIKRAYGGNGEL